MNPTDGKGHGKHGGHGQSSRQSTPFPRRVFRVLRVPISLLVGVSSAHGIPPATRHICNNQDAKEHSPAPFHQHAAGPSISVQSIINEDWHNPVTFDNNFASFFAEFLDRRSFGFSGGRVSLPISATDWHRRSAASRNVSKSNSHEKPQSSGITTMFFRATLVSRPLPRLGQLAFWQPFGLLYFLEISLCH